MGEDENPVTRSGSIISGLAENSLGSTLAIFLPYIIKRMFHLNSPVANDIFLD